MNPGRLTRSCATASGLRRLLLGHRRRHDRCTSCTAADDIGICVGGDTTDAVHRYVDRIADLLQERDPARIGVLARRVEDVSCQHVVRPEVLRLVGLLHRVDRCSHEGEVAQVLGVAQKLHGKVDPAYVELSGHIHGGVDRQGHVVPLAYLEALGRQHQQLVVAEVLLPEYYHLWMSRCKQSDLL